MTPKHDIQLMLKSCLQVDHMLVNQLFAGCNIGSKFLGILVLSEIYHHTLIFLKTHNQELVNLKTLFCDEIVFD